MFGKHRDERRHLVGVLYLILPVSNVLFDLFHFWPYKSLIGIDKL